MDFVVETSRLMIERGSRSFGAAAKLFDNRTRESAYMLYAWCRYCDDQIDGQELGFGVERSSGGSAEECLAQLCTTTCRAMSGDTMDSPVFEAFQRVVRRHEIPERYPLELLDGFAMDVRGHCYHELDDTLLYAYHVAGVVGVMMAMVMGIRDEATLNRAADLGIAFQLTNIARDVMEDADNGRVYLPGRWLQEADIPIDNIAASEHRMAVARVVSKLLSEADRYYESADYGLASLGFRCAWAIAAARGVYSDIGRLVLKRGAEAWDTRAVVGKSRKTYLGLRAGMKAIGANTVGRLGSAPPRYGLWTKPALYLGHLARRN